MSDSSDEVQKRIKECKKNKDHKLDLAGFGLESIPDELAKLSHLRTLNIRRNEIKNLQPLQNLTGLTELIAESNHIEDLSALLSLTALQSLDLYDNQVVDISPLQSLANLTRLDLSQNKIHDITPLLSLNKLVFLDISKNDIHSILPLQDLLQKGLKAKWREGNFNLFKGIFLKDNPFTEPPLDIVLKGTDSILNYLEALAEEEEKEQFVYEAKLLIVGEAGVGKTSLSRRLIDPHAEMPENIEDTTRGVELTECVFEETTQNPRFTMNIWDFGGQAIYHATHELFLSKRSLYINVLDGRVEENPEYWLLVQELMGKDSPLLLLLNKKGPIRNKVPLQQIQRRFTNVKDLVEIDLKEDIEGIAKVKHEIEKHIRTLPQFELGEKLPGKWIRIRQKLKLIDTNYINIKDFSEICHEFGILEEEQKEFLLDYLHDLGVILHFSDEPKLDQIIFLKPQWAMGALYSIIDHTKARDNYGHFTKEELRKVWDGYGYNDISGELLILMEKFELYYQLIDDPNQFIIPQLLPQDEPGFSQIEVLDEGAMWLKYKYDFLPKGILHRLIVRLHKLIKSQELVWNRGMILSLSDSIAVIFEEFNTKTIDIKVNGSIAEQFMGIITYELDQINSTYHFSERLKVGKLVPCLCGGCQNLLAQGRDPYFFRETVITLAYGKGKSHIACHLSFEDIEVKELAHRGFIILEESGKNIDISVSTLHELIEQNLLTEAIDQLSNLARIASEEQSIIGIKASYNKARQRLLDGSIQYAAYDLSINQIRERIFMLIRNFRKNGYISNN